MSRARLGRGLDVLLPAAPSGEGGRFREVPLDDLDPNPGQPRGSIAPEDIRSLAASIGARGVLEPIVVRERRGRFQIVAGERRWRAAREAGLSHVPVVIREVADRDLTLLALVENLQRQDLNPIEEALAFRRLSEEAGLTHERIAAEVGRSRSAVTNGLRLLDLAPEVRRLVETGQLRSAAARALLRLDPPAQRHLAEEVVRRRLAVREVERRVRALSGRGGAKVRRGRELDPNTRDAQERMERSVGLPVAVTRAQRGGTVRIRFFNEDDLHRVFLLLTNRLAERDV